MQPDDLPPREHFEARLQVGERWTLLAFILIVVGVVGLSKGLHPALALLILCGSGAASVLAAWFIIPAFLTLRRFYRSTHRRRDR